MTKQGTLLVTEWGRSMIYEMDPFAIPLRKEKEGCLFKDYLTTDKYIDSGIMESRGYRDKNIQAYNLHESSDLSWRVLGSHNAINWQTIYTPSKVLAAGEGAYKFITEPWNFIRVQTMSTVHHRPALVNVYIFMHR